MPASATPWSTSDRSACSKAAIILGIATVLAWDCAASAAGVDPGHSAAAQQGRGVGGHTGMEGGTKLARAVDPTRARLEQLSELEMKTFYARCSQEGVARRLDGGEAMACSIGYDVLLRKYFDGDFERLLAWSRHASELR
jgi:hypothetical protein